LNQLTPDEIRQELTQSRADIQRETGEMPAYFAYPTGAKSLEIQELVKECGYEAAFTIRYGQAGTDSNFYALERIPIFKSEKTFRSFYFRLNAAPLLERLGLIKV
jgi:peptidoglycan/xylan/chitin deacetylase (PgdA/CDA1 family)